jgi:hypothetical protein
MRRTWEPVSSGYPACNVPIALRPKKFRVVKVPWFGGVASRLVVDATSMRPGHPTWPVSAGGEQIANPQGAERCYFAWPQFSKVPS